MALAQAGADVALAARTQADLDLVATCYGPADPAVERLRRGIPPRRASVNWRTLLQARDSTPHAH